MQRIESGPSRVDKKVEVIREALRQEAWTTCLPGERVLSQHLDVSRPTLRIALDILEQEQRIKTSRGRRRLIVHQGLEKVSRRIKKVILLAKESESELSRTSLLYVQSLRRRLEAAGLSFEFYAHPAFGRSSVRSFQGLLPRPGAATVFVLFSLPTAVQRCCQDQGYVAVVAGASAEGVGFPSVDLDYQGIARHAVGVLISRGHRRLAFFTCDAGLAGDAMTESGFIEATKACGRRCDAAEIIRHRDDGEDIPGRLKRLMRPTSTRPTGILVGRPSHAVTILCALHRLGFRVPGDVSVICRDSDSCLDWTIPRISCYRFRAERFALHLARQVIESARGKALPSGACLLHPDFSVEDSLGIAPN